MARLVTVEVRVDLDLERLGLCNAFLLPDKEGIQQHEEVVQVACDVENRAPLDKANVLRIFCVSDHEANAR